MVNELTDLYYGATRVRGFRNERDALWFVADDICEMLLIGNSRMAIERLPDVMKDVIIVDTGGGPQEIPVVNEAGFHKLGIISGVEAPEIFVDWLATHVVPVLRKYGIFTTYIETLTGHIAEIRKQSTNARGQKNVDNRPAQSAPKTVSEVLREYLDKLVRREKAIKQFAMSPLMRESHVTLH